MNPILLDTHAVIWAAENALKPELIRRVEAAAARSELLISPISAWEIGMLIRRERLSLSFAPEEYVRVLFSQRGVIPAAWTPRLRWPPHCCRANRSPIRPIGFSSQRQWPTAHTS